MFHFFNKVYVDFEFNLAMGDRIIISSQYGQIPFDNIDGNEEYISVNYNAMIDDHWGGDEQALWTFLGGIPEDRKFTIYVDSATMVPLLVKYWRTIFPNIDNHELYILYRLTMMKFKMVHSQITHLWEEARLQYSQLVILDESDFIQTYLDPSHTTVVLPNTVRNNISLEYLFPSFFVNTDTAAVAEFEDRANKMIWKNVGWEINEFKRNMLNGFLNWDLLFPELVGNIDPATTSFEDVIALVPELAYIQDIDLTAHNLDVVKSYDVTKIFNVYYRLQKALHGDSDTIDGFLRAFETYAGTTESVLGGSPVPPFASGDIRTLVQSDVDAGFGTQLFARTEYRTKMNPLLISYFYQLQRDGDTTTLEKFALV